MSQMLQQKRASRGTRMAALVGEAAEQDETFWNDGIWQEAESDEESFVAEEEKPDVFDSDFDESETEEEEDSDDDKAAKRSEVKTSRNNTYKEPLKVRKPSVKRKDGVHSDDDTVIRVKKIKSESTYTNGHSVVADTTLARTIRKSTSAKTLSAEAARHIRDEEIRSKNRPFSPRVIHQFTQKEMLLETFDTVDSNEKWLVTQKLMADERAFEDRPVKAVNDSAYMRYHSKRGASRTITFSSNDAVPVVLRGDNMPPQKPDNICVITGLPARYKDPKTGQPYRDLAAFKELRARYDAL